MAAAISEEETPEDPATGGQDDAHGRTPARVTRVQLDTMRAKQERDEERQMGNLQRHGGTLAANYYHGSLPGRGKTSGRQGHGDRRGKTTHMEGLRKSPKLHKACPRDEFLVNKGEKF